MSDTTNNHDINTKAGEYDAVQVPYLAPQPPVTTASAPGPALPTISTLPPIATARPLGTLNPPAQTGSNIPVVNGVRQEPVVFAAAHASNPHYPPTVVNLSAAPSAAPPHMLPEMLPPPFFEYMDRCRYVAGFMLCYYMCTFFFLQPFFLGTLGIMTGFLGYFGSRAPIYASHVKWIRGFIWMNYSMLVLNTWYLVITVFFYNSLAALQRSGQDDSSSSAASEAGVYRTYNEQHLGLFIGVVVALNMMLHFRGILTARHFHAEMLRAGPLPDQRTVIVLSGNGHAPV